MFMAMKMSWALLLGMFLLMLGNGMQGTVLGVRGTIESFDPTTMGFVMSGYFVGFLGGAQTAPWLLRRVGHVRVFAALASLVSAAFILYPVVLEPAAWFLMRVIVGFCFSGLYVVAESWLNESTTNENRGQTLSAYMIVQMLGIIVAQGLLNVADPAGYELFVIMSVVVSVAVTPMLLSVQPAPVFETTRRMSLLQLYRSSPLGCVGAFVLGAVFSCLWGMAAVYGSARGLTTTEISIFVGAIYTGGLVLQYPIGWLSDRMDRRQLIAGLTALGAAASLFGALAGGVFPLLALAAFLIGGIANPLYSLIIAHTNDFLANEDMASASGGLIFLNGIGAAGTPILVGWLMDAFGTDVFLVFIALLMASIAVYAGYRMTIRAAKPAEETAPMAYYGPLATRVTAGIAQDWVIDKAGEEEAAPEGLEPSAARGG